MDLVDGLGLVGAVVQVAGAARVDGVALRELVDFLVLQAGLEHLVEAGLMDCLALLDFQALLVCLVILELVDLSG